VEHGMTTVQLLMNLISALCLNRHQSLLETLHSAHSALAFGSK
jgi:hypothetical protein